MLTLLRLPVRFFALISLLASWNTHAIERISVRSEALDSERFSVRELAARLDLRPAKSELRIAAREFKTAQERWRDVELLCAALRLEKDALACANAQLRSEKKILPLSFSLSSAPALELALKPQPGEVWQINADLRGAPHAKLRLSNAQAERLNTFLDAGQPRLSKGRFDGEVSFTQGNNGVTRLGGSVKMADITFADEASARIGEGVAGTLLLDATADASDAWRWRGDVNLTAGEIFWAPLYLQHTPARFSASGLYAQGTLREVQAQATLAKVGKLDANLRFNAKGDRIGGDVRADNIDLAGAYALAGKQLLEQPGGTQYEVSGRGSLALRYDANGAQSADLRIREGAISDSSGNLKLVGISADLPWVNARTSDGVVRIASGELWRVPMTKLEAQAQMKGYTALVPRLSFNVLDGIFAVNDLRIKREDGKWQWELTAGLTPISLEKLSKQLQWPQLSGTVSGVVPRLRYADEEVRLEGNMMFDVFKGKVVAQNLSLRKPLSGEQTVHGDVQMRALDLEVLTRTYSFGKITGLIDVDVKDMELRNWKPVHFDAKVYSSEGDYPRRISQQAVQNLSSLGGAGATAALQRSLLRFFETFRYRRLGLSCELRNSVCKMGGVAAAPQGYVIVQGGGIPAITVIGYNQNVSWVELLERVRRVTQGNAKAVVQ